MTTKPCIICIAMTGSLPRKEDNPAVPITISEQIESTQEAYEAGASIAHCHVRLDDGTPTADPDRFGLLQEGLIKHCPGMIIQFSTGGKSSSGGDRGKMLPLRPEMASLSTGSSSFPNNGVFANPRDLVEWLALEMVKYDIKPELEIFDLSHLHQAAALQKSGHIKGPLYVQFVMGIKNAMPVDKDVLDYYVKTLHRLTDDGEWCAAGIGPAQIILNDWCVAGGGHARAGLEDNVRLDRDTLAPSNASLVKRVVDLCDKYERPVATPQQARKLLRLRAG